MRQFLQRMVVSAVLATSASLASAATVNLAITGTATASNSLVGFEASRAIDGNVATAWNAGSPPLPDFSIETWIEIDLGSTQRIDTLRALTVQSPFGDTRHQLSLDGAAPVTVWDAYSENSQWLTFGFGSPVYARTLRITTVISPSWVSWAEIEVLSTLPVPVPAGFPLLLGGLAGFALVRRARCSARA